MKGLPIPPVEGETLLHSGVNRSEQSPVSTEIGACGGAESGGDAAGAVLKVAVVIPVTLASVDGDEAVGEPW